MRRTSVDQVPLDLGDVGVTRISEGEGLPAYRRVAKPEEVPPRYEVPPGYVESRNEVTQQVEPATMNSTERPNNRWARTGRYMRTWRF